jgi:hypothetical protein
MATQYSFGKIVTDGLVLCLDAADRNSYVSGSTTWRDIAGSNNGTLTNGPTFNTSNGGSIVFDGVNDYVTGFDNISINTTSSFTIEFWFNQLSFTDAYPTLIQLKTNTFYGWNLTISQNTGYVGFTFGSSGTWLTIKTDVVPVVGVWNHVIVTYNGAGSGVITNYKTYLNTIDQTLTNASGFAQTSQVNYIGTTNAGSRGVDDFNGRIAACRIYNRALSPQEVLQNYNAQKSRFGLT